MIQFERIGFGMPDGNVIYVERGGAVKWKKVPPADCQEFWDAVVLAKGDSPVPAGYTVQEAVNDWNAIVKELKANGKMAGNEEVSARKMWTVLKKLFPYVIK